MIWLFVTLKKNVVKLWVKEKTIFVLIWLERKMKVNIVLSEKNKNVYIECMPEIEAFQFFWECRTHSEPVRAQ